MKIDAHQHYWKLSRGDYSWITPDLPVLYRDYLPDDLESKLEGLGIDKTIVVQASSTLNETKFLLDLSDQTDSIAGVVGWIDFESDYFEEQFEKFHKHPSFIGVRIMLQDINDSEYVLRPYIIERLKFLADRSFPVDLLVKENQLSAIAKLVNLIPHLRGVINHIGKPDIKNGVFEPWAGWIQEIAKNENIYCKLSGMVTEADHQCWQYSDFEFYIQQIVSVFGSERILFGSDWPVCLLAAKYEQVENILKVMLSKIISEEEMKLIFGLNAIRFYQLKL